ncbi:unnamed protein product [Toxocara canis]|uniref:Zinc finger protein n=1 Tax=Toxocara canis TaxID=6265 RepID=A0A183UCA8_TOXCA|nr:unnamed protein product [Toxocara canis]
MTSEAMLHNFWATYRLPLLSLKSISPVEKNDNVSIPEERTHLRESKTTLVKKIKLRLCWQIFEIIHLQDHIIIHHERRYECERCTRTFVSEKRMYAHQMKKHSGKTDPRRKLYRCEQCGRTYETFYNFKEHLAKHDGKLFECSICNKQLSGQSALSRHSKIHDKPHECMLCSSRFSSAYDLDCHFSYYHSAIKRFKCEYCERVLYNYSGKLRHERLCAARPIASTTPQHRDTAGTALLPQCTPTQSTSMASSVTSAETAARKQAVNDSKGTTKSIRMTFQIKDILCDIPAFQDEHFDNSIAIASSNQAGVKPPQWENLGWTWGKRSIPSLESKAQRALRVAMIKKNPDWHDLGWTWGK